MKIIFRKYNKKLTSILDRYSKIIHLDLNYFIKNGLWLLIAYSVSTFMTLIITVILTRNLTQADYGLYQFIMSVLGTAAIVSLPGMKEALLQSITSGKKALKIITKERFKFSLLGIVGMLGVSGFFYFIKYNESWKIFLILAFIFPFMYSFDTYSQYLIGKKDFRRNTFYNIVYHFIFFLDILFSALIFKTVLAVIITFAIAISFTHLIFYLKLRREEKQTKLKEDKGVVKYGKQLSLINVIPTLGMHIDKIILPYFLGLEALAIYAVALVIPESLKNMIKNISPLFFSKIIKYEGKEFISILKNKWLYLVLIPIIIIVPFILISPYLIEYLFGDQYISSIIYAQILIASLIIAPINNILSTYLISQKNNKSLFYTNIITPISNIILFIILIPTLGIIGAVLSRIISRVIRMITTFLLIRK